ncbi:MAG TPA: hypothetical protein VFZ83_09510 [Acidimicrobiia bacterium]|nr:hypothetical protein [Acidimicrobiia bacterium]
MSRRAARAALAALALVVVLAGCEVDGQVAIRLDDDGTGTVAARVTLDPEALARLEAGGVPIDERVSLAGFEAAGWTVPEWERTLGGGATVRIAHAFSGEAELDRLLTDLFGADGWLRDPELDRQRGVIRSRDGVRVDADLTDLAGGVLDDAELVANLQAVGVDPNIVATQVAAGIADSFDLTVSLQVPRDGRRLYRLSPGDEQLLAMSSSATDYDRLVLAGIGILMVFLALLLYLAASISARRRRMVSAETRRIDLPMS